MRRFLVLAVFAASGCKLAVTTSVLKPVPTPSAVPVAAAVGGLVLGLDGKPAANVEVRAYIVSNNGGGIVSNNGGGIVANNGGGVVSSNTGRYALAQASQAKLTTRTDSQGRYHLAAATGAVLNVEAVQADDVKAIQLHVAGDVSLQLAYTGEIAGQVTAPGVTDLEGVQVFVPGTSYGAVADQAGRYVISGVPVGTFELAALQAGLGQATVSGVAVQSRQRTKAPDLVLQVTRPVLTGIEPDNAGPGAKVVLKGTNFGTSQGQLLGLKFNGSIATDLAPQPDGTLSATVPPGATSGDVVLSVGGINSNAVPFQVLQHVAFSAHPTRLVLGRRVMVKVSGTDTAGKPVELPGVAWTGSGSAVEYSPGGLDAKAVGHAEVTVRSGTVSDTLAIDVVGNVGEVTTLAGDGTAGLVDGPAAAARFNAPTGVAVAKDGAVYVADAGNHAIRKIVDGTVGTVAKGLDDPQWLAVDPDGNLIVTEYATNKVDKVTPQGVVTTLLASGLNHPKGVAVGPNGTIYVAEADGQRVTTLTAGVLAGSGQCALADGAGTAAAFCGPTGLAWDPHTGQLMLADLWHDMLRGVTAAGAVTQQGAAPSLHQPNGVAVAPDGTRYVTQPNDGHNELIRLTAQGQATIFAGATDAGYADGVGDQARFRFPASLAIDAQGRLLVADRDNHRIRVITP